MKVDRPIVRAADLDRVVLLVGEPMDKLKTKSPWAWRYLRYGMTATFRVQQVKACARAEAVNLCCPRSVVRLDRAGEAGLAFWPKVQQYRHIIAGKPGDGSSAITTCTTWHRTV